jgi:ribose transport system substrate-binding protein
MKRVIQFFAVSMLMMLLFAACGSNTPSSGSASSSPSSAPSSAPSSGTTSNAPSASTAPSASASSSPSAAPSPSDSGAKKKVAVLLWSRGFEFMVALDQGIQDLAKQMNVEVTVLDGNSNSQTQLRQIEDSIAKKVDAIILAPANSDELVAGVKKANEAKIPVVTVDAVLSPGADVASAVAFNNDRGGEMAAEHMIKLLGKGTVLENTGAQGTYHATLRGGGFNKGMKKSADFKVISKNAEWLAENAQNITADAVTANPAINGIFSHNDDMVRGILGGLRQINKAKKAGEAGHIVIVGVDGTPEALERIRNGEEDATIDQDPFVMGETAFKTTMDILGGKQVPKEQLTPPALITKDNVDDPKLWGNRFKK